jgi:cell division protein FtsN
MPKNEDGEFEVLLGNKQLLSIFFIVVILLAVFFTMGYIVGRSTNAAGQPPRAAVTPYSPGTSPAAGGGFAGQAPEEPKEDAAAPPAAGQNESVESAGTQPQQQLPSTGPLKPAAPPKAVAEPAAAAAPAAGQVYLQAVAGKRPDAELVASVLKRKGFPVIIAPGPTESVFRVLVGPFADSASMGKTRAELEAAGFKAFPRRY